ncbi:hypothetical protein CDD82_1965 [Ophiocordyceps australis]|uniref:Probable kinetochore protein NUF2 n=1 Tax=Ophiocordyceps australis TaxID=1399860 RepID=A0A2C5ZGI8_9HYPO|nr:hypothetical protein CDD82_1965 [Ophiocordyceps australis]
MFLVKLFTCAKPDGDQAAAHDHHITTIVFVTPQTLTCTDCVTTTQLKASTSRDNKPQGRKAIRAQRGENGVQPAIQHHTQLAAECIHDLGFNLSRADLEKPNPAQVQPIFELFADELLNTTREMVQPAMREVAEDMCGEFADVIPTDTRDLVGFYGQLQQLMLACGIKDFSFSDLYKLTPDRLAKIFSHAINLVRFRESQMAVMDEHLGQTESVKKRIEMLRDEVDKLGMQVEQERRNQQATEARTEEKKHRNNKLTELLSTTLSATGNLRSQVDELKDFKSQLVKRLREQSSTLARLRQESERMQSCLRESPSTLHDSVADLRDSLSRESGQADAVEKNHRALQTWVDVIDLVAVHVDESVKALHDIVPDVTREEEKAELSKATADELSKARKKERQLEQDMAMRRRQVDTWGERIKESSTRS